MYALRTQRWLGSDNPSGIADGMFVRGNGLFTESKASAMLFDHQEAATRFARAWFESGTRGLTHDGQTIPLFIVEVETKPVIQRVLGTISRMDPLNLDK